MLGIPKLVAGGVMLCLLAGGCQPGKRADSEKSSGSTAVDSGHDGHDHDEHGHDHPAHGPEGGELIELGNGTYHAELLHPAEGAVTVILLDGAAKAAVTTAAREATLNLVTEGKARQFVLAASPSAAEPGGETSRFAIVDAELSTLLGRETTTARLVVTIGDKQYSGVVEHHHDHDHEHK